MKLIQLFGKFLRLGEQAKYFCLFSVVLQKFRKTMYSQSGKAEDKYMGTDICMYVHTYL